MSSSTIARWLKVCLKNAGVDTSKFQADSIRTAATTKACLFGLTVEDILKAADWSSQGVFQKFYYKPMYSLAFGSSVLAKSTSTKSHVDMETKPSKYNFRMAQVMQWPPAIRNYMRKVRLKYQHVLQLFIL